MADDLDAPGASPTGYRASWFGGLESLSPTGWLLTAIGAIALVALGWIAIFDDPYGGEPIALVPLDRPTVDSADIGNTLSLRPTIDFRDAQSVPSAD